MPGKAEMLTTPELVMIAERWGGHAGGCEMYLACLADHARKRDLRVRILVRAAGENRPLSGISRIRTPSFPASLAAKGFDAGLSRELRRSPAAVVLAAFPATAATHYQPHHGSYRAAFEAERDSLDGYFRKACFPTANRFNLKRQVLLGMESRLMHARPQPRIMVFSFQMRRELHRSQGISEECVSVCPLGVDLGSYRPSRRGEVVSCDWRKRLDLPSGRLLLLFVAHNFRLKGLAPLLAALKESRQHGAGALLLVVGNGAKRPFEQLARRMGISESVRFAGVLPAPALADLYRQCDALMHPTFYDHCSLVTLEALASGCPVITTARNGAAELMDTGREGYVLEDPRDTPKLAEIIAMLGDCELRSNLRNEAISRRARLDFSIHASGVMRWLGLLGETHETVG